jgi:5-methylcytosine-specific restriction protein A
MSPRRRCIENRRSCSDGGYAVEGTSRCRAHSVGSASPAKRRRFACLCGAADCQHGRRSGWATHPPPANAYAYGSGWQARAKRVLERDGYQCQLRFPVICIGKATQVDHIVQPEAGGTNDLENLRAVCRPCHARRTGQQGALAKQRNAQRRQK